MTTLPQKPSSTFTFICTEDWPCSSHGTQTFTCPELTKDRYPGTLIPAEGTSNLWTLNLIGGHGLTGIGRAAGTPFMVNSFHSGGAGARPKQDGLSATPFPSGVRNVPVEATEVIGGYVSIAVADIDEATEIAKQCPGLPLGLTVEVRPLADVSPVLSEVRGRPAATVG